jgi:hypothetical protein
MVPVSDWLDSLTGPSGLLLVVYHLLAVPVSVLWAGLEKSYYLKLGCEKFFSRVTYWALVEMLLENRSMRTQNSCTASGGTCGMPQTVGLAVHKAPLKLSFLANRKKLYISYRWTLLCNILPWKVKMLLLDWSESKKIWFSLILR